MKPADSRTISLKKEITMLICYILKVNVKRKYITLTFPNSPVELLKCDISPITQEKGNTSSTVRNGK